MLKGSVKAAKAGFDWDNQNGAFLKLNEEINELKIALSHNNLAEIEDEFGDVLFPASIFHVLSVLTVKKL